MHAGKAVGQIPLNKDPLSVLQYTPTTDHVAKYKIVRGASALVPHQVLKKQTLFFIARQVTNSA